MQVERGGPQINIENGVLAQSRIYLDAEPPLSGGRVSNTWVTYP